MVYNKLNKFFSKKEIISKINSVDFDKYYFYNEVTYRYKILENSYRNEYYFKSLLFNDLFLKKFSLKTSAAINELNIGRSKADFCVINRVRGIVFEIKTDLDNLDRLIFQIEDYYKAFSFIYVVTTERNYYPVLKELNLYFPSVGIMTVSKNNILKERKKAIKNEQFLKHEDLFKLLRKQEYEEILNSKMKLPENIRPVEHYKTYLSYFKKIPIIDAQKSVLNKLKKRVNFRDLNEFKNLPFEIRWIIYSANLSEAEYKRILKKIT